jgi:hypothetical protein
MREKERERRNVLVCRVSSLGMLGEGGDRKKEKTWDKARTARVEKDWTRTRRYYA